VPLYEYHCESCGHRFEVIQKFSDEPVSVCPNCGKGPVVKLLSSPAIQFKGSGWYITDYARKDSSKPAGGAADSGSSSSTDSTAAKSTPAKTETPAAKTDTK
jgi:putative FmdB family regulatory protein